MLIIWWFSCAGQRRKVEGGKRWLEKDEIPNNCFMWLLEEMFCRHETDFPPPRLIIVRSCCDVSLCLLSIGVKCSESQPCPALLSRGMDSRDDSGCLLAQQWKGNCTFPFPCSCLSAEVVSTHTYNDMCTCWLSYGQGFLDPLEPQRSSRTVWSL